MEEERNHGKDQVAFIICSNNMQYYSECVRYIRELKLPEGYGTDIICIQEAESMARGYNAGMQSSEAKYKVYLHQDTFIINRDFIHSILKIFGEDEKIGMIGVLGATDLPKDADVYLHWNAGRVEAYTGLTTISGNMMQDKKKAYTPVKAVDGLIMVTQYDIPWREDLLDGWDFYDVSQALEMRKHGYKVVVPYQETPWCYHDCGASKLENYDYYRAKMIAAYPEEFSGSMQERQAGDRKEKRENTEKIRQGLIRLMDLKAYEEVGRIVSKLDLEEYPDTQIREIANLMEIYSLETDCVENVRSEWFAYSGWHPMREYYTWIRFVLLRAGYGREDERIEELQRKMEAGRISRDAVRKMAAAVLKDTAPVYRLFLGGLEKEPLVSVIMQVNNGERVIGQTIESILGQTYNNLEIIILDHGSTDQSREFIASFAKEDERIKTVFPDKKISIGSGGNICAKIAKGKYLAMIRQGDAWQKDKLEKQILFLEEHPSYGICFTWINVFGEMKQATWRRLYERFSGMNGSKEEWTGKLLLGENPFCTSSACIRKDIIDEAGFYHYGLVQLYDEYLWLKILLKWQGYMIQERLAWYRVEEYMGKDKDGPEPDIQMCRQKELEWMRLMFS